MSGTEVVVAALLAAGVLIQLTSVIGILAARDVYDRLHFTGPASIFTPLAIAVAVAIDFGPLTQAGIKAALTAAIVALLGPVLAHATARAARIRERGQLDYREPTRPIGGGER
ncbi:MAG TPA: monovalent cation/H(+) antiporter subunit G [Solirubrobacterales bacterium]|nr:monovalent cation/H(+) antiporter subunit G [Solirubrobacterales bacterium]